MHRGQPCENLREDSCLQAKEAPGETNPVDTLHPKLLASRILRIQIYVGEDTQSVVLCYGSLRKLHTPILSLLCRYCNIDSLYSLE